MTDRPLISVCIPAYNRVKHLPSLLDSILAQDFCNYEIVVCEDSSPDREKIAAVIKAYQSKTSTPIFYYENIENLGYDGNIRNLVEKAHGSFCFFMGNDDLMSDGALAEVASLISSRNNLGMVLKSYSWFDCSPDDITHTVRYFDSECDFNAGRQAIHACFRRSGVISGYIINRDVALRFATSQFDGSLYYQMHLTANVLATMPAVFTPKVLVLCRNSEPPDFGNSGSERGKYIPGRYTPEARLNMIGGAVAIVKALKVERGVDVVDCVLNDYANYFYPYIKDQLNLPFSEYWNLYRSYSRLGFGRYPMFHLYCFIAYLVGEKRFDWLISMSYRIFGRSLHFGKINKHSMKS